MSRSKSAFTLVELLVAMVVATILVSITVSLYGLIRTSMTQDQAKADAAQNARVALDRMTRELRQAADIVTNLPSDASDTTVAQPHEIEFLDGHANDMTYKRYYLSGTTMQLQVKEYYFSTDPTTRVAWNAKSGGVSPTSAVISTQDIAEMVQSLNVYEDGVVQVEVTTSDGANQIYRLQTAVQGRN
jgi:uncharacterized protein (TIGR02599 family)